MSLRQVTRNLYHSLVPDNIKPRVVHVGRAIVTNLERIASGGKPTEVTIETTTTCNRRCWYCPLDGSESGRIEDETYYSVVNQLEEWGFSGRFTPVGYNEPTFDGRIVGFIAYARKHLPHSDITMLSNGDFLTGAMLKEWFDAGMTDIRITIHDPASQDLVDKVHSMRHKFKGVRVADLREGHRTELLQNRGGLVDVGPVENMPACYHVDTMNICADGNVVLCSQDYKEQHIFGNVKITPIVKIWEGEEYTKLRSKIRWGIYSLDICKGCGYQKVDIFKK